MALLSQIQRADVVAQAAGGVAKKIDVKIDVGKTLALVLIALVVYAGAVVCYLANQGAGASGLLGVGSVILGGGLGVVTGEQTGAADAANKLA